MDESQKQALLEENPLSQRLQTVEIREFLSKGVRGWENPFYLTLTMKQTLLKPDFRRLTEDEASNNLHYFLNLVNRRVLGKKFQRFGTKLRVIAVAEFSAEKRLHSHLVLDRPAHWEPEAFKTLLETAWQKTTWADKHTDIKPVYDRVRLINYITKQSNLTEAVDWRNSTLT